MSSLTVLIYTPMTVERCISIPLVSVGRGLKLSSLSLWDGSVEKPAINTHSDQRLPTIFYIKDSQFKYVYILKPGCGVHKQQPVFIVYVIPYTVHYAL